MVLLRVLFDNVALGAEARDLESFDGVHELTGLRILTVQGHGVVLREDPLDAAEWIGILTGCLIATNALMVVQRGCGLCRLIAPGVAWQVRVIAFGVVSRVVKDDGACATFPVDDRRPLRE